MRLRNKFTVAFGLSVLAFLVYAFFCKKNYQNFNHFVLLSEAFLHGKLDIAPKSWLELAPFGNKYYVVYPPMPAIVLLPAVAVLGAALNQIWPSIFLASLSVGLFYLLALRFSQKGWISLLLAILFGFGTNFFVTALASQTWFFAHITAVFFLLLGLLLATDDPVRPFLAGAAFSCAFLSRLSIALALPLLLYFIVRGRPKYLKKSAFLFMAPVMGALLLLGWYNQARFGSPFQLGYSLIPGVLSELLYQKGIFHFSYIPRNLKAMFLLMPNFSLKFPFFLPSCFGMAIWMTAPALFLLLMGRRKDPHTLWFLATALLVALPSLMHGTFGFTQYGYRFSLDYIIFLLLPLAPIFERIGSKWSNLAVGLCVAINIWVAFLYHSGVFSL